MTTTKREYVDAAEIARRLGVKHKTVVMWRYRGLLPAEDLTLNGGPVWRWETIQAWAKDTGRV